MLAEQVRGGLVETTHDGALAVMKGDGSLVSSIGDIDRVFFFRSSAKPFQAFVSMEAGADLGPLELALACASHRGLPVHIAIVESMLARVGLDEAALQCPRDWPISDVAERILVAGGAEEMRRTWYNCSGKHAAFLRACVAQAWPIDSYLDPGHPLQRRVIQFVSELGEFSAEPVGIDGCGAPVLRTTVRAMALMYSRLATEERFGPIRQVMHRYPSLVGANTEGDSQIAITTNGAAKGGAAGCVGVAIDGQVGMAAKSWDGSDRVAYQAAAVALTHLGHVSPTGVDQLAAVLHPPVFGGEGVVGQFESRLVLS